MIVDLHINTSCMLGRYLFTIAISAISKNTYAPRRKIHRISFHSQNLRFVYAIPYICHIRAYELFKDGIRPFLCRNNRQNSVPLEKSFVNAHLYVKKSRKKVDRPSFLWGRFIFTVFQSWKSLFAIILRDFL